jgi:hypothetical protein
MATWISQEGLSLDVCSAGELAVACSAGFPPERILLHGNVKTPEDLRAAARYAVGRIVIDSAGEIGRIAATARRRQRVLVRVTPGVDAHAHHAVTTGVEDQKFGFSLSSGAAADAVRRVLAQPQLELVGLHCTPLGIHHLRIDPMLAVGPAAGVPEGSTTPRTVTPRRVTHRTVSPRSGMYRASRRRHGKHRCDDHSLHQQSRGPTLTGCAVHRRPGSVPTSAQARTQ